MIGGTRLKMDQSDLLFVTQCFPLRPSCMLLGKNSNSFLSFFFFFEFLFLLNSRHWSTCEKHRFDLNGPSQPAGLVSSQVSPHWKRGVIGVAAKSL